MIVTELRDERFQNKYIQLFIPLPIFIYEGTFENGSFVKGKLKKIIFTSTLAIGNIPIGFIVNIPFIIYLLIQIIGENTHNL